MSRAELNQALKVEICLFNFFFEHKLSLSSSPNKILYSNFAHVLVEQAQTCLQTT